MVATKSMDQMSNNATLLMRLIGKAKPTESGCLEWIGWRTATGYGSTYFAGRTAVTHRLMYEAAKGPIPPGMKVLHSCDNPSCINPLHLTVGTDAENIRQSVERNRHHEAKKTHCERGHELAGENLYVDPDGRRHCKHCERANSRMKAGWPEDLAWSVPKKQGWPPKGMMRVTPKPRRKQLSDTCTNGHALAGDNVYLTKRGYKECKRCRQNARDRFAAVRRAKEMTVSNAGAKP